MSTAAVVRTRETATPKLKLVKKPIVPATKSTRNSSSSSMEKNDETVRKELAAKNKSPSVVQTQIKPTKIKVGGGLESNKIISKKSIVSAPSSTPVGKVVKTPTTVKRVAADSTVELPLKVAGGAVTAVNKTATTAPKAVTVGRSVAVKKPIVATAKQTATTTPKISIGALKTTSPRSTLIAVKPSPTAIIAKVVKSSPTATSTIRKPPVKMTTAMKKPTAAAMATKRSGTALTSPKTNILKSKEAKKDDCKVTKTCDNESQTIDQTAATGLTDDSGEVQIRMADSTSDDANSENSVTNTTVAATSSPAVDESRVILVAEQIIEARIKWQLENDDTATAAAAAGQNRDENDRINAEESSTSWRGDHQSANVDLQTSIETERLIDLDEETAGKDVDEIVETNDRCQNESSLSIEHVETNYDTDCLRQNETMEPNNETAADRYKNETPQPIEPQVEQTAAVPVETDNNTIIEISNDSSNDIESSSSLVENCDENDDNTAVGIAVDCSGENDRKSYENGLEMREDYFGEESQVKLLRHESLPSIVDEFEVVNESYGDDITSPSEEDGTNAVSDVALVESLDENTMNTTSTTSDNDVASLEQPIIASEANVADTIAIVDENTSTTATAPFEGQTNDQIVSESDVKMDVEPVDGGDKNEEKSVEFTIPENELCSDDTLLERSIDESVNELRSIVNGDEDAIKTTRKNKRNKKQRRNRRGSRFGSQDGDGCGGGGGDGIGGNVHQLYEPQSLADEMACTAADYEYENGQHFKRKNSKRRNSTKKYNNYPSGRSGAVGIENYADSNGYYTNKMWRDVAIHDYYS